MLRTTKSSNYCYWQAQRSCVDMVSEFRVRERRKLQVIERSKIMRCSWYVNVGQMDVRLYGELLEGVDCFKYLESQMEADGGCEKDIVHIMNEGFEALGALKNVLSNTVLTRTNAKK